MEHLTVYFDDDCDFCRACRDWLAARDQLIPLRFVPVASPEGRRRIGHIEGYGDDLMVAAPDGRLWTGTDAFLMCLWALSGGHEWVPVLTLPGIGAITRVYFRELSRRREHSVLARFMGVRKHRCVGGCSIPGHSLASTAPYR